MMSTCELRKSFDPPVVINRVREGLPLVDIICHQVRRHLGLVVRMEDLVSHGREGLLSAARSYDPGRGVPFRRWANIRVRGAVIDGVRASATLPRSVYSRLRAMGAARASESSREEDRAEGSHIWPQDADRRLDEYLAGAATAIALGFAGPSADQNGEPTDRSPSAEETLMREELLLAIRAAIAELPVTERRLLTRHYFEGVTFEHAAAELGLSKSWASRLHTRAVEAITRSMKRSRRV